MTRNPGPRAAAKPYDDRMFTRKTWDVKIGDTIWSEKGRYWSVLILIFFIASFAVVAAWGAAMQYATSHFRVVYWNAQITNRCVGLRIESRFADGPALPEWCKPRLAGIEIEPRMDAPPS